MRTPDFTGSMQSDLERAKNRIKALIDVQEHLLLRAVMEHKQKIDRSQLKTFMKQAGVSRDVQEKMTAKDKVKRVRSAVALTQMRIFPPTHHHHPPTHLTQSPQNSPLQTSF